MVKTEKTFQNPAHTEGVPQHYFIEITSDYSIRFGFITELTDLSHRKNYFPTAQAFYDVLEIDLSTVKYSEDNTLIFIHGWNGAYLARFSGYVNSFHHHYVEENTLNRTISIIWHKGNLGYSASREKTISFSEKISADFKKLIEFLNRNALNQMVTHKTHLLCYSMGNYFFQHIFQHVDHHQKWFSQIILAAPDLDCNVFERGNGFENLYKIADEITVLQHRSDRLLGASKLILKRNRLGRNGLTVNTNVTYIKIIDFTGLGISVGLKDKITHHLYFYRNNHGVEIIRQRLKNIS